MALYAPDGVTMAQHFPSQVGADAIRAWYSNCFANITLTVDFTVVEVVPTGDDYAFARTTSAGTTKIHATGASTAEANQELFVMKKIGGDWKIARYCFATTNPPH